ncbi:hypothetical protein AB0I34_30570 [Kribbella sp. NPDC050281]|uniref:hypothetical protein n=1 Tax=Kribbella sp. NPDC050281 TaxID=3155515 RepID=UPI0033DC2521
MANEWIGTAVLAAALTVAGCNSSVENRGDQVAPSSTQPTSTLTIGGMTERVTDVAAFAITDEEAKRIEKACAEAGGVPGDSEECAAILRDLTGDPVDDCAEAHGACIVAAVVDDAGGPTPSPLTPRIAWIIFDPRPGKPACGSGKSSICDGAILSAKVAPLPTVETTASTETTTPPSPSTTSPSPDESTPATDPTEPEPTEPDPTEPESPDSP